MTDAAFLLGALIIGALWGYVFAVWLFHRERKRMGYDWLEIAGHHEDHAKRLRQDDTRMGINEGIGFAVERMRDTLNELDEHIDKKA